MVSASKPAPTPASLLQQVGARSCRQLVHPWAESCWGGPRVVARRTLAGMCRFSLPIYAAQLLMGGWRPDPASAAMSLVRSLCYGTSLASGIVGFHCMFRHLLGGYKSSTLLFWPTFLASASVYLEDERRKATVLFYFVNWVLEWVFRRLQARRPALGSRAAHTLLFAAANAGLMWALRRGSYPRTMPVFWFFKPARQPRDDDCRNSCLHKGPCWTHGATLSAKYLLAGVALQMARALIGKWQSRSLSRRNTSVGALLLASVWNKNSLGLFLGAYTALYQAVSCALCRLRGGDEPWHALPAGAASGLAFCLNPDLTLGMAALTTLLQVSLSRWLDRRLLEPTFALCLALLVNAYFAERHNCPPAFIAMTEIISPGLIDGMYKRLWYMQ